MLPLDEEPDLDADFLDIMIAQSDQDALTIQSFENEFEEFLQETPELFEAFTTYMDARARLLEKRKTRGFWPVGASGTSKGKGKTAFKGFKGKSKSKSRDSLLQRIARSHCRRCGALGHWKAECPQRGSNEGSTMKDAQSTASAHVAEHDIPVVTFYAEDQGDDVVSDQEEPEAHPSVSCSDFNEGILTCVAEEDCYFQYNNNNSSMPQVSAHHMSSRGKDRIHRWSQHAHRLHSRMQKFVSSAQPKICTSSPASDVISVHHKLRSHDGMAQNESRRFNFDVSSEVFVVADQLASHAILDTGASRCIIGDKTFSRLCQVLPERLLKSIKNRPSQVKFRFGNNQTLTSMYQVLFPLKQAPNSKLLNLAVEVVPGYTPFLFSKRAFKLLGGILDTQTDSCQLSAINTQVKLALSPTGLYLLNITDICREYNPGVSEAAFAIQSCPAGVSSEHAGESKATTESVSQCLTQSNTRAKCVSSAPFEHPTCRKFPIRRVCQQNAQHGRVYQDHSQCTGASSHVALAAGSSPAGRIVDRDGRDSPNRDVQSSRSDDAGTADASSSVGNVGSTPEQSSCQPQDVDHRSDVPTDVRSKSESKQPECQSTWEESKQSGLCSRGSTIGFGVGLRGRALHDRPFRRHHHQSSALGESDGCSDNFLNDCCSSPSRKSIDQGKNLITRHSGDSTSRPDSGCLGATCHQLGKETQGQAILRGPEGRPGVLRVEPSRARYNSLPPDQQDFVRYCQVALSRYNLPDGQ